MLSVAVGDKTKICMKNKLRYVIFLLITINSYLLTAYSQTPTVGKVEPPNWWADYSISTVRVLIRGTNLKGAKVIADKGLTANGVKVSDNGHYLFADVTIPKSVKVGKYNLKISTLGRNSQRTV